VLAVTRRPLDEHDHRLSAKERPLVTLDGTKRAIMAAA